MKWSFDTLFFYLNVPQGLQTPVHVGCIFSPFFTFCHPRWTDSCVGAEKHSPTCYPDERSRSLLLCTAGWVNSSSTKRSQTTVTMPWTQPLLAVTLTTLFCFTVKHPSAVKYRQGNWNTCNLVWQTCSFSDQLPQKVKQIWEFHIRPWEIISPLLPAGTQEFWAVALAAFHLKLAAAPFFDQQGHKELVGFSLKPLSKERRKKNCNPQRKYHRHRLSGCF